MARLSLVTVALCFAYNTLILGFTDGQKAPVGSIPAANQQASDIGELAVIHYGEKESVKAESVKDESLKSESEKAPSVRSVSLKSGKSAKSASDKGSKTRSQPPSLMGESIPGNEILGS